MKWGWFKTRCKRPKINCSDGTIDGVCFSLEHKKIVILQKRQKSFCGRISFKTKSNFLVNFPWNIDWKSTARQNARDSQHCLKVLPILPSTIIDRHVHIHRGDSYHAWDRRLHHSWMPLLQQLPDQWLLTQECQQYRHSISSFNAPSLLAFAQLLELRHFGTFILCKMVLLSCQPKSL